MTSLQNGNYNSRSMNGLTSIYANDINVDVVNTIDANVSNNLDVGNDLSVGDGLSVTGVSQFNNDLIIYDKGSPVYPYRFRTIGRRLVLQYDNPTTRTYLDCSFNTFGSPQLWFPNQIVCNFSAFFNSDLYIADTKRIFLGDIAGGAASQFQYSQTTKTLTITSGFGGGTGSNMTFQTNNAAGAPFQIQFNPTQLSIPVNIVATGDYSSTNGNLTLTNGNITLTNGIISQNASTTNQNTIKETTITGTAPITIYPRQPPSADATMINAIAFSDNASVSGRSGFFLQNVSGTNDLINFGVNAFYFGNRNTAQASGSIRFDTRNTGSSHIIQFRIERPLTTSTSELCWACDEPTSRNINFFDAEFRLKGIFRDTITPFTNTTEISKNGASLTIAGLNASSTLTISNRNASNVASNTFVSSTATTDITSTNINLNGAISTTTNNINQTSGRILQTGTTPANTLGGVTLVANSDLTFGIGTGRINQSSNTSVNLMSAITMNNANNLTYQDTTIQRTAFTESVLNECEIHSWVNGTTLPILFSTFNLGNATNAALAGVGQFTYHFIAVKLITNQVYNGIGMYCGTAAASAWEFALYARGTTPARLVTTGIQGSTANIMNYFSFATPYTYTGATGIAYVAWRTTATAQTALYLPVNTFLNYNKTTFTNGRLDKRTQLGTITSNIAFPATLGAGLVMTTLNSYAYVVLY